MSFWISDYSVYVYELSNSKFSALNLMHTKVLAL